MESAEASGAITEDESDELLLLDLIVSGTRRGNPERVYAGIEVSMTANDDDVNRAADRAQILRKVTGGPVMAVVIADRVEAQQRGTGGAKGGRGGGAPRVEVADIRALDSSSRLEVAVMERSGPPPHQPAASPQFSVSWGPWNRLTELYTRFC